MKMNGSLKGIMVEGMLDCFRNMGNFIQYGCPSYERLSNLFNEFETQYLPILMKKRNPFSERVVRRYISTRQLCEQIHHGGISLK